MKICIKTMQKKIRPRARANVARTHEDIIMTIVIHGKVSASPDVNLEVFEEFNDDVGVRQHAYRVGDGADVALSIHGSKTMTLRAVPAGEPQQAKPAPADVPGEEKPFPRDPRARDPRAPRALSPSSVFVPVAIQHGDADSAFDLAVLARENDVDLPLNLVPPGTTMDVLVPEHGVILVYLLLHAPDDESGA